MTNRSGTIKNGFAFRSFFSRVIRRGSLFFLSFGFALLFLMASSASAQTTWVVNGTGDASGTTPCASSPCSTLRSAIYAANADTGDTIDVTATGTIDLTSRLPQITSNMTINGPGASALTISGQGQYQIFNAPNGTTLAVSGLTLADGNAGSGGGGAIYSTAVTVANCTFIGNSAPAQSSSDLAVGGGAIWADVITVSNSTFTDNSSYGGGGAILDVVPKGTMSIANSTFTGNSSATEGGAMDQNGPLTVTNSTFSGNSAPAGGAVYWGGINFTMTVTNSTFTGNSASGQSPLGGGAIYWRNGNNGNTLTVTNSIFSGNSAPSGSGGGIDDQVGGTVTESNNLYYGNTGGDIIVAGTPQGLSSSDVTGSNPSLTPLGNYGGPTETMMPEPGSAAICNGNAADLTAALTAANSLDPDVSTAADLQTPDPDISTTADQRGFPITAPNGVSDGACANGNVDIGAVQTNYLLVTSTSNSSSTNGSLLYQVSIADGQSYTDIGFSPTLGGGSPTITPSATLDLSQGDTVIIGPPDAVTISGELQIFQVYGSSTASLYGLTLTDGDTSAILNSGTLTVAGSTFEGNSAHDGGGAIDNVGGTLTVTNSTFYGNHTLGGSSGGAIYSTGTLTVTNSTFDSNSASQGGAIFSGSGTLTVVNSIFDGNSASQGGGIKRGSSTVNESDNLFYDNYLIGTTTESDASGFTLNESGTDVIGLNPNLATLGNYGGPTQTMLPLPGSAAICAGTPALPFGLMLPTTDQRGFSRTTTYTVNSSPLTCVDIGAVETNYQSIQFTNIPTDTNNNPVPYTEFAGQPVNPPAPSISVTENGQTIPGVSVTLNVGSLTGLTTNVETTQGTLNDAAASFGQLTVPLADAGDTYTLSSTLNLFTPKGATTPVTITTNPTANLAVSLNPSSVTDYVDYLGSIGTLDSGQVNSLTKEWDKAISMGTDLKFSGAINNLNDFIAEVNDLLSSGVLTQTEADALINAANYQISQYQQGLQ